MTYMYTDLRIKSCWENPIFNHADRSFSAAPILFSKLSPHVLSKTLAEFWGHDPDRIPSYDKVDMTLTEFHPGQGGHDPTRIPP